MLSRLAASVRALITRKRTLAEADEELRFHLEHEEAANRARGMSPADARRAARRDLGGLVQARERVRDVRSGWTDALTASLRYALRRWRHRPGLGSAAILILGLGIASATATFSVVDAVLLEPLPWVQSDSLVIVHGVYPARRNNTATAPTWDRWYLSFPAWEALRASSAFEAVGAWYPAQLDTTFGERRDEIIATLNVSSNFLPMLGVKLVRGRFFSEAEDSTRSDSIILTHEIWRRRFGARDDIVGERVLLGNASSSESRIPKTVVGVIAAGFEFNGIRPEILRPFGEARRPPASSLTLRVVARLAPGVSLPSAEAQATALVSSLAGEQPFINEDGQATIQRIPGDVRPASARLVTIADEQLGPSRRPLWLLFGGAGILLLLACANVAGLLLGEARVRRHEFALRTALGGTRLQLIRQLAVEHGLLAVGGSVVGLIVTYWLIAVLVAIAPSGMPRIETTALDVRAALFAIAAGMATLLAFGILPALVSARTPERRILHDTSRDGGPGRLVTQRLIVVVQVALALVLLTGASLFGETILRLRAQPLGFEPAGVAIISTTFTGSLYGDSATVQAAWKAAGPRSNPGVVLGPLRRATTIARTEAILARLTAIEGVLSASATSALPFVTDPWVEQIVLEGSTDGERHDVLRQVVTEGYFETMGVTLLSGRSFQAGEVNGPPIAVVSSAFERRFFPGGAVGRRFSNVWPYDPSTAYRIVGVVADVKRQEPTDEDRPAFYWDYRQGSTPNHFVIRSALDPSRLLPEARRIIGEVSPQAVVTSMTTMPSRVDDAMVEERFRATLSVIFGAAALALAAGGLYGLATRRVVDRSREFAVRVALGAGPADIRRLVVWDAVAIVSIGFAVGLPSSYVAAHVARSLLFGVTSTSPHVFVMTGTLLAIVVATATIVPARVAGRIDPVAALKR